MPEHILFITGKLAEKQLHRILEQMQPTDFTYTVHQLGVSVAALITADMMQRRLKETFDADRVIIPGRCRGDLERLSNHFQIPFERGPEELKDLPAYFGSTAAPHDLSRYDIRIFAEITEAPTMTIDAILEQAGRYRRDGADVIDIGCLPDTPFPHLEETIRTLKQDGFEVSIDSLQADDLLRGGRAGADYMLSLQEKTVWIADEVDAKPVLIPAVHGDLDSLDQAVASMDAKGRPYLIDPILDPIHFGFADSLVRYHQARQLYPEAEILMGVGNLTELTHADTAGINALLLGICSELRITAILATQVSRHACKAVREADLARRILYTARESNMLPKHVDDGLMALHECAPFPYEPKEIEELAGQIRDPSFRIQISREGVHIFNRDGLHSAIDPFNLYPKLGVENDGGHAFYLGVQLARAQIAWLLGKRFTQDEPLTWGCAVEPEPEDLSTLKEAGTTMKKTKEPKQV
jgi:dihydropteroate synthase-like protein